MYEEDELIARLGHDDYVIELRCVRPNLFKLVQWFKDDEDVKDTIYVWQSGISALIEVLKQAQQE